MGKWLNWLRMSGDLLCLFVTGCVGHRRLGLGGHLVWSPQRTKPSLHICRGRGNRRECLFVIRWPECQRLKLLLPHISRCCWTTRNRMLMERKRMIWKGCSHSNFTLAVWKVRVNSDRDFKSYGSLYVASNFEHDVCAYHAHCSWTIWDHVPTTLSRSFSKSSATRKHVGHAQRQSSYEPSEKRNWLWQGLCNEAR